MKVDSIACGESLITLAMGDLQITGQDVEELRAWVLVGSLVALIVGREKFGEVGGDVAVVGNGAETFEKIAGEGSTSLRQAGTLVGADDAEEVFSFEFEKVA